LQARLPETKLHDRFMLGSARLAQRRKRQIPALT
jgi:hypothetical protein